MNLNPLCNFGAQNKTSISLLKLNQAFQTECFSKSECQLDVSDQMLLSNENCVYEGKNIFLLAICEPADVPHQDFGRIIVGLDIACITVFIIANILQTKISQQAVEEVKDLNLQVKEFAVEVRGLPPISECGS